MKNKKYIISLISLLAFLSVFFLVWLSVSYQQEKVRQNVMYGIRKIMDDRIDKIVDDMLYITTLENLQCNSARNKLIRRASYNTDVRSYILVQKGVAYCSSSLGNMTEPVENYLLGVDLDETYSIGLSQGVLSSENSPLITLWIGGENLGSKTGVLATIPLSIESYKTIVFTSERIDGIALVINDKAVVTSTDKIIPKSELPNPIVRVTSERYGYEVYVFGDNLSLSMWYEILFLSVLIALMSGLLSYFYLGNNRDMKTLILRGIKNDQFFVLYQPVFSLRDGSLSGFEVLLRWKHPTQGLIPPDQFISYAEHSGMIIPLTQHLFTLIINDSASLAEIYPARTKIAINISAIHLNSPYFIDDLMSFYQQLPQNHFICVLEITERVLIEDNESAEHIFVKLRALGFLIAIDDFGTGHSALIYLQKHKVDYLKIDKGFIQSIGLETIHTPVLDSILQMAHSMGMEVVAEGVETSAQLLYLRNLNVDHAQGFLFSHPLSKEQLISHPVADITL
ncbi:MAG: cyclic di-GMP phosphodiesterase [Plesiomonas sp.]|uniref:cyclic di-GMP phosphodiesterase n=1 Tax=Plesiomonas sp. TaxID=2486279 RepID=UPI003F2EC239